MTFLTSKMVKNYNIRGQILTKNFDFRGHLFTFRTENSPKIGSFKSKNNALRNPEQLQNNFQKVQKMTFLVPKMVKTRVSNLAKKVNFGLNFD